MIDPIFLREIIIAHLIGKDNIGKNDMNFFNQNFYNYMMNPRTEFIPIIYRDFFVTIDQVQHDLLKLREANEPFYFGWDILKQFDVDYEDLGYERPKEEKSKDSEEDKLDRKKAKLHTILYQVYTFARFENTIDPT